MADFDLLIRDAGLPDGTRGDVAILGEAFAAIGPSISGTAVAEIDAGGLLALPGVVDPHVHFNEPGARSHWEGWESGSAAAAAGGATTVVEMPLNASPPTVDAATFDAKRESAVRLSRVDFGLWGGVIPGNRDQLKPLAERGATGFKAFMSTSGVEDFPACDDLTLYEAMSVIAELGVPLAVHAESDTITMRLAERARSEGRCGTRDYLGSRPAVAESEAIARAIELAAVTGCSLHIVHTSTARGVELVAQARAGGIEVTCEVAPHHLLLAEDDAVRLGAIAKCAPPLRPREETEAMWRGLAAGEVAWVASDHSPAPPELKTGDDAFEIWGGISSVQSTLELMLSEGYLGRGLSIARIATVTSTAAAERLRLAGKGRLEAGADADLTLVATGESRRLSEDELRYRHPHSPYIGRELRARVVTTLLRGQPVYRDGELVGPPRGRLVTPAGSPAHPAPAPRRRR